MRYYKIVIYPVNGGPPVIFTSLTNSGGYNGAALELSVDIYQYKYATPAGMPFIQLKGISYEVISQISNFNGATIQISLGMSAGLPLANPQEAALIVNGTIYQAFANWQGNQISLDIVSVYAIGSPLNPVNLSGTWPKNQTMQSWVEQMLTQAYPKINISGSFNSDLVYTEDAYIYAQDLDQFSSKIEALSHQIIKDPTYFGAQIALTAGGFYLFDGSNTSQTPLEITYYDIIGNLTWIDSITIQAKLVMRGDLFVGQLIHFPDKIQSLIVILL